MKRVKSIDILGRLNERYDTAYESLAECGAVSEVAPATESEFGRSPYRVVLGQSFDKIKFGMSRDAVHTAMGNPTRSFKKFKSSTSNTDAYPNFDVFYDENDCTEAVEVHSGVVTVSGKTVFPTSVKDIRKVISDLKQNGDSAGHLTSPKNGVGLSYNKNGEVTDILFASSSYYAAQESVFIKLHDKVHKTMSSVRSFSHYQNAPHFPTAREALQEMEDTGSEDFKCTIGKYQVHINLKNWKDGSPEVSNVMIQTMLSNVDRIHKDVCMSMVNEYNSTKGKEGPWYWQQWGYKERSLKDVEHEVGLDVVSIFISDGKVNAEYWFNDGTQSNRALYYGHSIVISLNDNKNDGRGKYLGSDKDLAWSLEG